MDPADSQIEQQSQDDNNATEVDNNITEQSENTILDDATHPERQPDITQQSTREASNAGIIQTRSKSGIHKPKLPYIGLVETYKDTVEPTNAKDALTRPLWKEAIQKEFQALMSNKTWTLFPYQDEENIVDSKWVFKTKYKSDGTMEKRKVRLFAKGFQQTTDIDYEETFIPVVKASIVRIILSIAIHLNWEVRKLDINMFS